jgi:hypothetical protein
VPGGCYQRPKSARHESPQVPPLACVRVHLLRRRFRCPPWPPRVSRPGGTEEARSGAARSASRRLHPGAGPISIPNPYGRDRRPPTTSTWGALRCRRRFAGWVLPCASCGRTVQHCPCFVPVLGRGPGRGFANGHKRWLSRSGLPPGQTPPRRLGPNDVLLSTPETESTWDRVGAGVGVCASEPLGDLPLRPAAEARRPACRRRFRRPLGSPSSPGSAAWRRRPGEERVVRVVMAVKVERHTEPCTPAGRCAAARWSRRPFAAPEGTPPRGARGGGVCVRAMHGAPAAAIRALLQCFQRVSHLDPGEGVVHVVVAGREVVDPTGCSHLLQPPLRTPVPTAGAPSGRPRIALSPAWGWWWSWPAGWCL